MSIKTQTNLADRLRNTTPSIILLAAIFTLLLSTYASNSKSADNVSQHTKQIIQRMQQGGLVVFFRHAATDRSDEDQHPVDLDHCDTQRNLSELGKKQSAEIGTAFKRLSIPVAEVISSPFCRCKDTAHIAFGDFDLNSSLYFAVALNKQKRDAQTKVLQGMISDIPESGNRIIVSHTGNLREATRLWPKPEGAAYVFEPTGNGQYKVLGLIIPDEWRNLNQ